MKKIITLIFLLCFSLEGFSQKEEFNGLIKISKSRGMSLEVCNSKSVKKGERGVTTFVEMRKDTSHIYYYKDSLNGNPVCKFITFYDMIYNVPIKFMLPQKFIMPFYSNVRGALWTDMYTIILKCKSKKGKWYEIMPLTDSEETLWIRKRANTKLVSWKKLLSKPFYTATFKHSDQKGYLKPDINSTEINFKGYTCFRILKVKENWIKVVSENIEGCPSYDDDIERIEGWIQFKNDRDLLVEIGIW